VSSRPKLLRPSTGYTHSHKEIRDYFLIDKSVIASVDVSPWMGAALNHKESLDEQFMEPRIPVLAVAKYVRTFCLLLINDNIKPVLVFDGQGVPLKPDTNEKLPLLMMMPMMPILWNPKQLLLRPTMTMNNPSSSTTPDTGTTPDTNHDTTIDNSRRWWSHQHRDHDHRYHLLFF